MIAHLEEIVSPPVLDEAAKHYIRYIRREFSIVAIDVQYMCSLLLNMHTSNICVGFVFWLLKHILFFFRAVSSQSDLIL